MSAAATTIVTDRLRLEPFAPAHLDGLFAMNADPDTMRYLGGTQSREEVARGIAVQQEKWAEHSFGWWAVLERATEEVVGAACLQYLAQIEANPLEIGWRLHPKGRGEGYATEAGQAAMDYGFDVIRETRLVAVADPKNSASIRVMERLGMTYIGMQTHYEVLCATYEIERAIG